MAHPTEPPNYPIIICTSNSLLISLSSFVAGATLGLLKGISTTLLLTLQKNIGEIFLLLLGGGLTLDHPLSCH